MALHLPILLGTIRHERRSEWVARYVESRLRERPGITTRILDPRDWPFGNLDLREWEMDPQPPKVAQFVGEVARADGFVIVAPEYNHGYPGTLKNMLDAVYDEWGEKPFAFVTVGGLSGGLRMVESLRSVIAGLGAISVPAHVPVQHVAKTWSPEGPTDGTDWAHRFDLLFDELSWYAEALKAARVEAEA